MSTTAEQLIQRGLAHQRAGQLGEAVLTFLHAAEEQPDRLETWCRLANAREAQGNWDQAIRAYQKAIALKPEFAELHCNLGMVCLRLRRFGEATNHLKTAVSLKPALAEAWNGLGVAQKAQGEIENAEVSFTHAISVNPSYSEARYNLGNTLQAQERFSEAIEAYRSVLNTSPLHVDALNNLSCALFAVGEKEAAAEAVQRVIALAPTLAPAWNQWGNICLDRGDLADARAAFSKAIEIDPAFSEARTNLGNVELAANQPEAALLRYREVLSKNPTFATANFNAAIAHLLLGELREGFEQYEYRWESEQKRFRRQFPAPLWTGREAVAGKTILVHCEQGIGDSLQFFRYLPDLVERGAQVLLEVQPPLVRLLSGRPGIAVYPKGGAETLAFDFYCPILSLPRAFATEIRSIPARVPYIYASAEASARWELRLQPSPKPRIGLVVSGNARHKNDLRRSIALAAFREMTEAFPATWILVQKDIRGADAETLSTLPAVKNVASELADFDETAGLLAQLDHIISVDTSVAHLAGAMGKPVSLLLPYAPDWRWMLNRDDSPWYPMMRLYRQEKPGDWSAPLSRVRENVQKRSK